ncbi:hypothetical protein I7I48_06246 [Histoplasma ohiense]|nr:hypothetical protein I7I48_06246 [Histoplasma ohiense (nom. inval.)]
MHSATQAPVEAVLKGARISRRDQPHGKKKRKSVRAWAFLSPFSFLAVSYAARGVCFLSYLHSNCVDTYAAV